MKRNREQGNGHRRNPVLFDARAARRFLKSGRIYLQNGRICPVSLWQDNILYIESVDRRCFVYTTEKVYESDSKLYELERQLEEYLFMRINKSAIVNLKNIKSIKTYINRRLLITMNNEEQLIVSRQYADDIKELLGGK